MEIKTNASLQIKKVLLMGENWINHKFAQILFIY